MNGICHVVCAGPCEKLEIVPGSNDLLIAVDGGYEYCIRAGLEPDIFIGDMDSSPEALVLPMGCECIKLPIEKDDTDTLAACKVGLERGYSDFRIYAALGGDLGHEIANIQTLSFLSTRMAKGMLFGDKQRVCLVRPETSPLTYFAPRGTRVSVFCFGGKAKGVFERGMHWELTDATLESDYPLGVSNYIEGDEFEISVREGMLLVVIG